MSYIHYNPNPDGKVVGDCVVRALTVMFNDTWNNVFADLTMQAAYMHDMPSSDAVWGEFLRLNGFTKHILPNTCPNCYTINHFTKEYPIGMYVVATGTHVVAVVDGNFYDTSNSGNEMIIYYWKKEI